MSHMTRRSLLRSTALIPVALAVNGCAGLPVNVSVAVPAWTNAIQAIGQFLSQQFLPSIQSAGVSIGSGTMGTITSIINGISAAASGVNSATTQSQGAGVLATIENFVNQLAPDVAPFLSLIPGAGPILSIVFAALPAVEGLVNMGTSLLTPLVTQIAAAPVPAAPTVGARFAAPAPLTPAQALAVLLQKTGRG